MRLRSFALLVVTPWLFLAASTAMGCGGGGAGVTSGGNGEGAGGLGGSGGESPVIAETTNVPLFVAVDADHVYWTEGTSISRVPKGGGTKEIVTTLPSPATSFAVDESSAYWTSSDPMAVASAPKKGGATVVLVPKPLSLNGTHDLILDGTHVYWNETGDTVRVPKTGGATESVWSGSGSLGALLVDSVNAYLVNAPLVQRAHKDGSEKSAINPVDLGDITGGAALAGTETDLFVCASQSDGHAFLRRVAKSGGAPSVIAELESTGKPLALAHDAENLYCATATAIVRAPLAGGAATYLVKGAKVTGFALDEANIYFADADAKAIKKLPR